MEGLLFGFILALFSLAGAIVWDIIKRGQEARQQDEVILIAIKSEIENNVSILERNVQLLQSEWQLLEKDQRIVAPLTLLMNGGWEILRGHIPHKLTEKPDTLTKLNELFVVIENLNEIIRSREAFRINSFGASDVAGQLTQYDGIIFHEIIPLIRSIVALDPILQLGVENNGDIKKLLSLKIENL